VKVLAPPDTKTQTLSRDQTGTTVRNYKFGEILGQGANGKVYKVLNIDTGDVVAIKQVESSPHAHREHPRADAPLPLPASQHCPSPQSPRVSDCPAQPVKLPEHPVSAPGGVLPRSFPALLRLRFERLQLMHLGGRCGSKLTRNKFSPALEFGVWGSGVLQIPETTRHATPGHTL
jgi:hypothetical protein